MIQALPPPPPAEHCVAAAYVKHGSGYLVLSGDPLQLDAVLGALKPVWTIEAQATSNGVGFARLKGPIDMKYRDIGASIIEAQQRGLTVSFFTVPRICGPDDE
jgi:hypothetical protein